MPFPPLAPRLCMGGHLHISPRHLLGQVIEAGATHVYLEKPGAPSVAELQEMKDFAASKGVPVFMGYNKNVTPYVKKALEFEVRHSRATLLPHRFPPLRLRVLRWLRRCP